MRKGDLMQIDESKRRGFKTLSKKCMVFAGSVLFCWLGSEAGACGLDWSLPSNHFDGVDEQGHVSYWEKIGELDCGDSLVLPLHINFNSKRNTGVPSPYLGQGWLLPLLESKFIQESEDRFVMIQPDGLNNLFLRAEPNGTVLNGSAGWKGEINGSTITAWAPCGWKVVFANGRIVAMTTPKGRRLDWVYENGKVTEIKEGNLTRLKLVYGIHGQLTALMLQNGLNIGIKQSKKPSVRIIGRESTIVGFDDSLDELTPSTGQKSMFKFGVDAENYPTLKIDRENDIIYSFTWDPLNERIKSDGTWGYQMHYDKNSSDQPSLHRADLHGNTEEFVLDTSAGKEIMIRNQNRRETTYFVSGKTAGLIKKIIDFDDSKHASKLIYQAEYDENGRRIREFSDGQLHFVNQSIGKMESASIGVEKKRVDGDGATNIHVVWPKTGASRIYVLSQTNVLSLAQQTSPETNEK